MAASPTRHVGRVRPDGPDGGQATVELALATPVLCLLVLGIVQLAIVVRDQLSVLEAARVAARAAVMAADPASAAAAAVAHGGAGLHHETRRTSTVVAHGVVTVSVTMTSVTDVPLIGALLPDVEVRGMAAMILEPP